jgi:hypothetical protein
MEKHPTRGYHTRGLVGAYYPSEGILGTPEGYVWLIPYVDCNLAICG